MKQDDEHESEINRCEFSGIGERCGIIPTWLAVVSGVMLFRYARIRG
jgi:hypothetical protein